MKMKHQLYEEATERNVRRSLKKPKYDVSIDATVDDKAKLFKKIKSSLGIRESDSTYDSQIKARINA